MLRKYKNKRIFADGQWFDSQKEYKRYLQLKLLLKSGDITDFKTQVYFPLAFNCNCGKINKISYDSKRQANYIADFVYSDENGNRIIEDVKSPITKANPVYKLKKAIMQAMGFEIRET